MGDFAGGGTFAWANGARDVRVAVAGIVTSSYCHGICSTAADCVVA
jgi:hypothetical protein